MCIKTDKPELPVCVGGLVPHLRTAEHALLGTQLSSEILFSIRATRRSITRRLPQPSGSRNDSKEDHGAFFIDSHQSGIRMTDTLQTLSKTSTFEGRGFAPHILFDPDRIESELELCSLDDDAQLTLETAIGILPSGLAYGVNMAVNKKSKFCWPRFSYEHSRPTTQDARQAVEAFVAQAYERLDFPAASYSSGARVFLPSPILQHPGERLAKLSRQPEFPDYTKVYFHIVDKGGVTPFHIEDNGLRSFNLCHIGYKAWVIINDSSRPTFEQYVRSKLGLTADAGSQLCDQFVRHVGALCSPTELDKAGIRYRVIVQGPGEFVTTTSSEYHMVLGLTSSIATSHNYLHPDDDTDLLTVLKDAKLCVECGNYLLVRDYNVNHSSELGRLVPTVQEHVDGVSANKGAEGKGDAGCSNSKSPVDDGASGMRSKDPGVVPDRQSGGSRRSDDGGDTNKRPASFVAVNAAKRRKHLPAPCPSPSDAVAGDGEEEGPTRTTSAVAASSSMGLASRKGLRSRPTAHGSRPATRRNGRDVAAALPSPTPTSATAPLRRNRSHSHSQSPTEEERSSSSSSSGSGSDEGLASTAGVVRIRDGNASTGNVSISTSSSCSSRRHVCIDTFDAYYKSNRIPMDQLVSAPANDKCGLAAILYTKHQLNEFFAAARLYAEHCHDASPSDLEKGLMSPHDDVEDELVHALRNALLTLVKGSALEQQKHATDFKKRFFCYHVRRLFEDARLQSTYGEYKRLGDGQIQLSEKKKIALVLKCLPPEWHNKDLTELSQHVKTIETTGQLWHSAAGSLGIGLLAIVPYRRRDKHPLNVAATYYYRDLCRKDRSTPGRWQDFRQALDTPYMRTLLDAATALGEAILENKQIRFAFQDYRGDKPISSLPEAEICRLLQISTNAESHVDTPESLPSLG